MKDKLYIEYMPLHQLKEAENNPKEHDIENLIKSMERFGYVEPIVINESSGKLIAGHGRKETLISLFDQNLDPPDHIEIRDDDWYVPVIRGNYLEHKDEENGYIIASNQLTINGGWNEKLFKEFTEDLYTRDKLDGTGYSIADIVKNTEEILGFHKSEEQNITTQSEEKKEAEWKDFNVREGQIWGIKSNTLHGFTHKILIGDCFKDLHKLSKQYNGVITGAPRLDLENYCYGLRDFQDLIKDVLKPKGSFFITIKSQSKEGERDTYLHEFIIRMTKTFSWRYIDEFIWYNPNCMPGKWNNRLKNSYQTIFQFSLSTIINFFPKNYTENPKEDMQRLINDYEEDPDQISSVVSSVIEQDGVQISNLIKVSPERGIRKFHPESYPKELVIPFLMIYSNKGDVWLDPFLGSGTTIRAAEEAQRICYGVENDLTYVNKTLNILEEEGLEVILIK